MGGPWHHVECAPKGGEVGVFVVTSSSVVEVRNWQHTPEQPMLLQVHSDVGQGMWVEASVRPATRTWGMSNGFIVPGTL